MTLCPIIPSLWNLFSLNWEQNAILRARNPVRHHLKMCISQPGICPFSATIFKICFPLLSRLIASMQWLPSCGCAKQWLGTRMSLSWIQPRLCWGLGKVAFVSSCQQCLRGRHKVLATWEGKVWAASQVLCIGCKLWTRPGLSGGSYGLCLLLYSISGCFLQCCRRTDNSFHVPVHPNYCSPIFSFQIAPLYLHFFHHQRGL